VAYPRRAYTRIDNSRKVPAAVLELNGLNCVAAARAAGDQISSESSAAAWPARSVDMPAAGVEERRLDRKSRK
jgi:hypothetical protein